MNQNHFVVIMAGGIGSRFWPMSRIAYPKQFLDILNTGKTLLQATFERFRTFIPDENIYVITADKYVDIVKNQLPTISSQNIVGEPERKNTAPCIALMSIKIKKTNPDANLLIVPSDHLISDQEQFETNCLEALAYTENNDAFVTLGIQPTYANTGYGYIQYENTEHGGEMKKVKRFTEKPDEKKAIQFFKDPTYLWNSGIFFWKAADILNAFKKHVPEMYYAFDQRVDEINTKDEKQAVREIYQTCTSISIDYAILEKAKNVYVIPASFSWSDLGAYQSAWEHIAKDEFQNAVSGKNALIVDSNSCFVHSTEKKLVLLGGVEDLIVVNTPDALMVCKKENEQEIKKYLAIVKQSKGALYH